MSLRLTDTLTGETRPFEPEGEVVGIYSCGPTVYGPAHVGNFRSFLFADLLRPPPALARLRGPLGHEHHRRRRQDHPRRRGRRDRHRGAGRPIPGGLPRGRPVAAHDARPTSCRARPSTSTRWPRSSRRSSPAAMPTGPTTARSSSGSRRGRRTGGWPGWTPSRCGPASGSRPTSTPRTTSATSRSGRARSPASRAGRRRSGAGRPGWHIECSAMSMAYLGPSFDIHTGGVDLIFPHHEDEIAQSEAATGQPFVRTWLHCAHLQMGGAKMAKSAGNIARVGELLASGISPRALRYALVAVHYRARLDYSDESLAAAGAAVARLDAAVAALEAYREDRPGRSGAARAPRRCPDRVRGRARRRPEHLGRARRGLRPGPRAEPPDRGPVALDCRCGERSATLRDLDQVLGVLPDDSGRPRRGRARDAGRTRGGARLLGTGPSSDRLRDALADRGIAVEDTRDGQRWRRLVESGRG